MGKKKSSDTKEGIIVGIIRSVEEVLPEDFGLIHIILLAVIGLMVCSLISEPNSVVEGLLVSDCKNESDVQNCPSDATLNQKGAGETSEWECLKDNNPVDKKLSCRTTTNIPTEFKLVKSKGNGICSPKNSDTSGIDQCKDNKGKKLCSNDTTCRWIECGKKDTWSTSTYLKDRHHDDIVRCIDSSNRVYDKDKYPWFTDVTKFPLYDADDVDGNTNLQIPGKKFGLKEQSNNFLTVVGCKYDQSKNKVSCNGSKLPGGVVKKVEALANKCANGWDSNDNIKELYKSNGGFCSDKGINGTACSKENSKGIGGPIMGFDQSHGLVCKNSIRDSIELTVSNPRLVTTEACTGGGRKSPCHSGTCLKNMETGSIWNDEVVASFNDWIGGVNCDNSCYKANNSTLRCLPTHLTDYGSNKTRQGIEWVLR